MAVHSLVSPMLEAGIEQAAMANSTPESMGISTTFYRGMDCASLKDHVDIINTQRSAQGADAFTVKTYGWRLDAVNQVRAEQGCNTPAQAKSAAAAQVPTYGFCWYTPTDSRRHFVSNTFRYADWYADHGEREQQQYNALLKSSYGQPAASSVCQGEDSQPKAEAARQRSLAMYPLARVSNTNVAFTPTTPPPRPQAATAARSGTAVVPVVSRPSVTSTSTPAQGAFKAQFELVTPAFAQSLGLGSPAGALVIDTEKGGSAEKAGLRPLDVITEVAGQVVSTPDDLQAIVGRMRPGYKAAVRVWRQKAMRDMVIEVAAPVR